MENVFTPEAIEAASKKTAHLQSNLDITNADHIALWLENNLPDASLGWLACRIIEAHETTRHQSQEPLMEVLRALRNALYEQVDECFDEACEMCARHEPLIQRADTILSGEVDRS